MTGFLQPRRRQLRWPPAKWLVGAMLAFLGALAPIESPDVSRPLGDLIGTSPALAQTGAVSQGTPDSCPKDPLDTRPWQVDLADSSQCELLLPPCLATAWDSTVYLLPSSQYPELCEISVLNSDPNYAACTATTGVVVDDDGVRCRIIQNAICPSGVRVSPTNCRTVERRSWTCPSDSIPRNEFNSCYKVPTPSYGAVHPACGAGAPIFVISSCETYVGDDFAQNASTVDCNTYDPWRNTSHFGGVTGNDFWCTYDASHLDLDCHAPGASCPVKTALCLKRASETGGCSVAAKTIRCRDLQADYAAGSILLDDVRNARCEPCVILPFQSIPSSCPEDLTDEPTQDSRSRKRIVALEAILREGRDIFIGHPDCYRVTGGYETGGPLGGITRVGGEPLAGHADCAVLDPPCPDPSPGRLTWASSHSSQLAVVNSPVVIEILDIPTVYRTQRYGYVWGAGLRFKSRIVVEYPEPDTAEPDNILRLWNNPNDAVAYVDVPALANNSVSGTSECFLYYLPLFKIIVRELWPDNPSDRKDIDELFGADALQWWNNIGTQQERELRTKAQGFEWWPSLSPAEEIARTAKMTQNIRCDSNRNAAAWCRWQAPKPGYYKLTGAGAWVPTDAGNREWMDPSAVGRVNQHLRSLSLSTPEARAEFLSRLGVSTPQEAGINASMDALLPFTNDDSLFSTLSVQARCPPLDVRVKCLGVRGSGNYTKTEPIGIIVHETRASTVRPSN